MPMVRPKLSPEQVSIRPKNDFLGPVRALPVENQGLTTGTCRYRTRLQWLVPLSIRDFRPDDFETLWLMDQECFAPGIAYSRQELKTYMRHRSSFTLLAEDERSSIAGF